MPAATIFLYLLCGPLRCRIQVICVTGGYRRSSRRRAPRLARARFPMGRAPGIFSPEFRIMTGSPCEEVVKQTPSAGPELAANTREIRNTVIDADIRLAKWGWVVLAIAHCGSSISCPQSRLGISWCGIWLRAGCHRNHIGMAGHLKVRGDTHQYRHTPSEVAGTVKAARHALMWL